MVAAAVRSAQSELQGPIRAYVHVLVEHLARDRPAVAAVKPSEHHDWLPCFLLVESCARVITLVRYYRRD